MGVRFYKNGWEVKAYDPAIKKLRYMGRFDTEEKAQEFFDTVTARRDDLKRCPGCRKLFLPEDSWQKRCSERCERNVQKRVRRAQERRTDDHWTYTCLDEAGEVIYVGVTSTGLRRSREHGREKIWWPQVATIRVEHFATRAEALQAEADRIMQFKPRFNVLLNPELDQAA